MRLWRESVWEIQADCKMFVKIARYVGREIRQRGRISCQSGDGVLFQLAHKLANPVHPRFTLLQVLHELQARGTVQAEVLGLLLQQADQPHRIDVVFSLNSITPPFSLLSSLRILTFAPADADGRYPAGCGRHRAGGQNDRSARL